MMSIIVRMLLIFCAAWLTTSSVGAVAAPEGTVVIGLSSLGAEDWLVPARPQANALAVIPVFDTLLQRDD